MIWLILILSAIALIIIGVVLETKTDSSFELMYGIGGLGLFFLLCFLFVGTFFSSLNHVNDLESVQYHEKRIEIQTERLERLRSTLEDFEYPESALMNDDSPVASIVNQISDTEIAIAEAKKSVAETKRDIRSRKRWLFSFVAYIIE